MDVTSLLNTATDCLYFVTSFFEVISQSAPHIYHSALLLAPQSSIIQKLYGQETHSMVKRIVTGAPSSWDLLPNRIQSSYPEISTSPSPHNMSKPHHGYGNYLVAYSADRAHIAISQQGASVVTVFDSHLDILQWSIDTAMEIQDIRLFSNIIVVLDSHKLVIWSLKAGVIVNTPHGASTVDVDEPLAFDVCLDTGKNLRLSKCCSYVAFTVDREVCLYNVKSQKINKYMAQGQVEDIQFSPVGYQLEVVGVQLQGPFAQSYFGLPRQIEATEASFTTKHKVKRVKYLQSPQGHYIRDGFKWVVDFRGRKVLWIPPNWRGRDGHDVRWEGNSLVIVNGQHLGPIIIEF